MLTAGAALALVGFVGTASPLLGGLALSGAADSGGQELREAAGAPADASEGYTFDGTSAGGAESAGEEPAELQPLQSEDAAEPDADSGGDTERLVLTDDRPVWPMLLFAGVAIMIAAALLRWILAPRAG